MRRKGGGGEGQLRLSDVLKRMARTDGTESTESPEASSPEGGGEQVVAIQLGDIVPSPYQPRMQIAPDALQELAASLAETGLLQPIVVRPLSQGYELVTGERRWRAAQQLGWATIPAIIRSLTDEAAGALAMIENLQREDLTPVEEALGYRRLLHQFGWTQAELGRRIGKSQSSVANKLRLLRLPDSVLARVGPQGLTERHARALLRLPDAEAQDEMAAAMEKHGWKVDESERRVEAWLQKDGEDEEPPAPRRRVVRVFKDMRLFRNSILQVIADMERTGLDVNVEEEVNREPDASSWEIRLIVRKAEGRGTAGE